MNMKANKLNKEKVNITVPAETVREVRKLADKESRTFSNMIAVMLERQLKNKTA